MRRRLLEEYRVGFFQEYSLFFGVEKKKPVCITVCLFFNSKNCLNTIDHISCWECSGAQRSITRGANKLGCTDTPFLASCRCRTRVEHRNGYDSPDTGVRRVSSFFFFFVSPTRADAAPTRPRHGCDAAPTRPTRQQ